MNNIIRQMRNLREAEEGGVPYRLWNFPGGRPGKSHLGHAEAVWVLFDLSAMVRDGEK